VLPHRGFWSLLCGPFYAHVYTKWQVVLPVVLCCAGLFVKDVLYVRLKLFDTYMLLYICKAFLVLV
jgi:hypothetical protein